MTIQTNTTVKRGRGRPPGSKNKPRTNPDDVNFQSNPKLKKVGVQFALTQEQVDEYNKCADDPKYFIEKYVKFMTIDEGSVSVELWPFQKHIIDSYHNDRMVIVKTCRQVGKALAVDTHISTPTGWKTMGSLKVGDKVFGSDGKPTTVTYVTETMYNHKCYKVTFDSGYSVVADADHIWTAHILSTKKHGNDWTTEELYQRLPSVKAAGQGISIKTQSAVEYNSGQLPIDPYLFGLWLGDGHSAAGRYTCADYDFPYYEKEIQRSGEQLSKSGFKLDGREFCPHTGYFEIKALTRKLDDLGVINNKHIPEIYKRASIYNRQELIRGLMDSDGCADVKKHLKSGNLRVTCQFSQKVGKLLDDVREVFSSLGVKTRSGVCSDNKYGTITCTTNLFPLFKLPRKAERLQHIQGNYQIKNHYIKSIEPVESVPVRCIQVDAKDHLYLCGEGFIPTHNTTVTVGYILHYVLFNKQKTVGVMAQKEKVASEILNKIKMAFEYIPLWMQQGIVGWNKTTIELENGCRILSESTSTGAIRGFTINLLYLDEFAHVPSHIAEDFITSVYPTISSGKTSKIIITSTPLGLNLFYKFWMDAIKEKKDPSNWNGFKAIETTWSEVPGRDQAWADQQKKILGPRKYAQDIEAEFLGSSNTLIEGKKLRELAFIQPERQLFNDTLAIYESMRAGHSYVLSADPATGQGLDYSAFSVFDVTTVPYKVVARFKDNKCDDLLFASFIQQTAVHYNGAYVIVENNDIGAQVLKNLIYELDYDNCFYSMTEEHGELTVTQASKAKIPGIRTSKKVKTQGCLKLKTLIENDQIIITDFDMISELSTFILHKNKQYAAEDGYHDDTTSTLWLFAWLTNQPFFKDISDLNLRERLYAEREAQMLEYLPPPPIVEGNVRPAPKLEVMDGCIWVDSSMSYEQAIDMLNGTEDDKW